MVMSLILVGFCLFHAKNTLQSEPCFCPAIISLLPSGRLPYHQIWLKHDALLFAIRLRNAGEKERASQTTHLLQRLANGAQRYFQVLRVLYAITSDEGNVIRHAHTQST